MFWLSQQNTPTLDTVYGSSMINNDSNFLILKLCWIVIHHWKGLENTVSEHFSLQF